MTDLGCDPSDCGLGWQRVTHRDCLPLLLLLFPPRGEFDLCLGEFFRCCLEELDRPRLCDCFLCGLLFLRPWRPLMPFLEASWLKAQESPLGQAPVLIQCLQSLGAIADFEAATAVPW